MKKILTFISVFFLNTIIFANTSSTAPHFLIQMQNRSNTDATISFSPQIGNVYLDPTLPDHTPLPINSTSSKYGVVIDPLLPEDTFDIIFTGKHDCTFTVGFYAPADPKITMQGPGCSGGGYQIIDNGMTLLLFISDIHQ